MTEVISWYTLKKEESATRNTVRISSNTEAATASKEKVKKKKIPPMPLAGLKCQIASGNQVSASCQLFSNVHLHGKGHEPHFVWACMIYSVFVFGMPSCICSKSRV